MLVLFCLSILCVLPRFTQAEAPLVLVGVSPEDAAESGKYGSVARGLAFRCTSSSEELPAAAVNDNFCDCADGSDEPGTAACGGRSDANFYCRNVGSLARLVYGSRVCDGICDCCDGSDEGAQCHRSQSVSCPNSCKTEGDALREERENKRISIHEGLRIVQESEEKAKTSEAAWRGELAVMDGELDALEQTVAEVKTRKEEAQSKVDQEKKQKAALQANATDQGQDFLFREDFEGDLVLGSGGRWASDTSNGGSAHIISDPDEGKRGKVLALKACTWGGDAFSVQDFSCSVASKCKISFWARGAPWQGFSAGAKRTEKALEDAHSWLAIPSSNADFPDRLLSTRATSQWAFYEYQFPSKDEFQMFGSDAVTFANQKLHIMLQAHSSTGKCAQTLFDDFKVWKDASSVKFADADGDVVEFRLNDLGGVDAYANDEHVATDVQDLDVEDGRTIYFKEMRTTVPEGQEAIVERVMALYRGRPAAVASAVHEAPAEDKKKEEVADGADTAKKAEVSEYAKWALDQKDGGEKQTAEAAPEDDDPGPTKEVKKEWTRIGKTENKVPDKSDFEKDLQNATDSLREAERAVRDSKSSRKDVESKLKHLESGYRWFSMIDACPEKKIDEYTYKICYFGTAKQGSTALGTFSGWDPADSSALLFTNGARCHNGPSRTLRVQLLCGPQEEILDVDEPSRCSYAARMLHPGACTQEQLALLEEAHTVVLRPHQSHDEL